MMMRRSTVRSMTHYPKALPDSTGVLQARWIWIQFLKPWEYKFESFKALTEEDLSVETWEGCTSYEFKENPNKYKRLNDLVMAKIRELDRGPKKRLDRVWKGNQVKICLSSKKTALKKETFLTNLASGCVASAVEQNELFGLGQDVGKQVMVGVNEKLSKIASLSVEKREEISKNFAINTCLEAGRLIGKQEVVDSVLGVLDNRPALIAMDDSRNDEYSGQAKARRGRR